MAESNNQNGVTSGEVLEFLKEHMVMKEDFDQDIKGINSEMQSIRSEMVTKEYLDEKLGDLRGDLTVLMRKEDVKLRELITILQTKQVLTPEEVKRLLQLEPFPTLSL